MNQCKPYLISVLLFFVSALHAQEDTQITFAKERFKALATLDSLELDSLYLTKDEFLDLARQVVREGNRSEKDILEDAKRNYDLEKKEHLKNYYQAFKPPFVQAAQCDSIDWNAVEIDTIVYEYEILEQGRDKRITWPESRIFALPANRFVINETAIYFHDNKYSYLVSFQFLAYNNGWRIFHSTKIPRVMRRNV